ncbi:alpha/beta hydrolase [Lysinibacillus sp. G4S2]|uniref:alpha/beta hydrolase n=1 Tax=Lysinibacillus sp. G4S2 TaxID=3055859 RepID=UPI0025A16EED|nr:alpha/beta hydrolase [Lysinibacillus sp. G4S2]MDM5247896.1 alpha/beta hydrolase [Lysinibacillus sp. G4S2]
MLDPQAKVFLDTLKGRPSNSTLTVEENRAKNKELRKLAGPTESVAEVRDYMIPVEGGEIGLRIYKPEGEGLFPIFIYIHGGGWVLGDLETVDVPCRNIVNKANCIVVSVDYRLAPEHKFPTPLMDCYAAAKWVFEHAHELNGDSEKIAVGGDSAGGNLAAAVTMMARKSGEFNFVSQVLIYPVVDFSFNTDSYKENGKDYFLTYESMVWFSQAYLEKETDKGNIYAAPLLAEDLTKLPPALVITAEYDPLRDEGLAYAERLKSAGVPVTSTCYKGMIHGFFWMSGILEQGKEAVNEVATYLANNFNKLNVFGKEEIT